LRGLPADQLVALRPVKGQILRLHDPAGPGLLTRVIRMGTSYITPRGDGRYVIGATSEERGFDQTVTAGAAFELLRSMCRLFRYTNQRQIDLSSLDVLGRVAAVIGHDFGSPVAAYCALIRPDVFQSVALMSAPFGGPPQLPFNTAEEPTPSVAPDPSSVFEDLARLDPPRKHYQRYYQTREANDNMWRAPQGLHAFLRAYYHCKSADWAGNKPFKLASFTARELARMPTYYIMDLAKGMAETAAEHMPSEEQVAACKWLTDTQLSVYASEFARTGFQGALQWYRCLTGKYVSELETFSGRTIDVPACFIAGKSDWGVYQVPGALERMETTACTQWRGTHLVDGAGHWVQQEQPETVSRLLLQFVDG